MPRPALTLALLVLVYVPTSARPDGALPSSARLDAVLPALQWGHLFITAKDGTRRVAPEVEAFQGRKVTVTGFMARMEEAPHGALYLALVLVTADHECSGFSLIGALTSTAKGFAGPTDSARNLPSDAAALDPATPPARQALVGTFDAAAFPAYAIRPDGYPASYDVDGKLLVGFGGNGDRFESWLTPGKPSRESLTPAKLASELAAKGYASNVPVTRPEKANGFFIRGQAVGAEQAVHTATDIPISAYARDPFVWLTFVGVQKNTDVFFKIAAAMGDDG